VLSVASANFAILVLVSVIGLVLGLGLPEFLRQTLLRIPEALRVLDLGDYETDSTETETSVNLAILYATLALVLASIVSEWPPEGQVFPDFLETDVFFGSALCAAVIVGRVGRLIVEVELN
jgi:hypothetical protein